MGDLTPSASFPRLFLYARAMGWEREAMALDLRPICAPSGALAAGLKGSFSPVFSPETLNSSLLPAGRAVGGEILEFLLGFPNALPRSSRRLGRRPRGAVLSRCGLRKTGIFYGPGAAPSDARFLNFFSGRGRACLQVVGSPVVLLGSPSSRPGRILRRKK